MKFSARHLALVLSQLLMSAGAVPADGPQLSLGDGCVTADGLELQMPVLLSGDEFMPSSLKTTLTFDPVLMELLEHDDRPAVRQGHPAYRRSPAVFSYESRPAEGRVDLVWHMQGQSPVPPLPAGVLARISFRLLPDAATARAIDVALDAGLTYSVDADGRDLPTSVSEPSTIWVGEYGPWLEMEEDNRLSIGAVQEGRQDEVWILRGERNSRRPGSRHQLHAALASLEALPVQADGRVALDPQEPAAGEAFFYVAARPSPLVLPVMGFFSTCHDSVVMSAKE